MFSVQSIVMAQKLKGTLSFIAKVRSHPWSQGPQPPSCSSLPRYGPTPPLGAVPHSAPRAPQPLSYALLQDEDGATQEKLDFKLHFSCSSYLLTTPCCRCAQPREGRLRGVP